MWSIWWLLGYFLKGFYFHAIHVTFSLSDRNIWHKVYNERRPGLQRPGENKMIYVLSKSQIYVTRLGSHTAEWLLLYLITSCGTTETEVKCVCVRKRLRYLLVCECVCLWNRISNSRLTLAWHDSVSVTIFNFPSDPLLRSICALYVTH